MIMAKCKVVLFMSVLFAVESLFAGDSCVGDGSVSGRCTPLSDCQPLLDEIKRAGHPMPMYLRQKLQALQCGFQSSEPVVCCETGDNDNKDTTRDVDTTTRANDNNPFFGGDDNRNGKPNEQLVDISNHRNLKLLPKQCGFIESDRIFGGNRTRLYEMPWMVLIVYKSSRGGMALSCGGSLINERYVLTAAHCVSFLGKRLTLTAARLGEHDTREDPDCERLDGELQCAPSVWDVDIEQVIAHPGYSPQSLYDDIALLRLSRAADFNLDTMKPICLPSTPELQNEKIVGKAGTVAGWGAAEDGLSSPVLLSVDLPIVSNQECQAAYKGQVQIYASQLCAGGIKDADSCSGDSGGPLLCPGKTPVGVRFVQRGIISYGSKRCGIGGYPGVYTNVGYYMDWILDNIRR